MKRADQNRQTLTYADGYSYTEIFNAPEIPGVPSGNRLVSVFHAFFTEDRDNESASDAPRTVQPMSQIAEPVSDV
ncbi:hypothetical protein [Pseudomonas sp. DNDY-54]|uniref:hypothetical protein n=1 Tax=Pseudomonas sp. DNDY-54 TaxID=2870860 RepID=UPI001CA3AC0D|nr:hypothetical protein [Pseudomonas sp. DNDY-54]